MGGSKHWILYLVEIAILCAVVVSLRPENQQRPNRQNQDNKKHVSILRALEKRFKHVTRPLNSQYGVLYIPPPHNPSSLIFIPKKIPFPLNLDRTNPIYPPNTDRANHSVSCNYAVAVPDGRAKPKAARHTEDTLLNHVWRGILSWYRGRYGHRRFEPRRQPQVNVYMYSYIISCSPCSEIIRNFAKRNPSVTLCVGFRDSSWRWGDEDLKAVMEMCAILPESWASNISNVRFFNLAMTSENPRCQRRGEQRGERGERRNKRQGHDEL